jgi:hypothetical protein
MRWRPPARRDVNSRERLEAGEKPGTLRFGQLVVVSAALVGGAGFGKVCLAFIDLAQQGVGLGMGRGSLNQLLERLDGGIGLPLLILVEG